MGKSLDKMNMKKNEGITKKRLAHIKKERKEHVLRTGTVITGANEIQLKAGYLISLFYFEKADYKFRLRFIHEVTSGKNSNFKLVTDILRALLLERYPERKEYFLSFCKNKMDKIGIIRNRFAHEFLIHGNTGQPYFPSRKKEHMPWNEEGEEIEKLFKEFTGLRDAAKKELQSIIDMKTVEMSLNREVAR